MGNFIDSVDANDFLLINAQEQLEYIGEYELSEALSGCQINIEKVKEGETWNTSGTDYQYVRLTFNAPSCSLATIEKELKKLPSIILKVFNNVLMAQGFIHVQWAPIVKLLPTPLPIENAEERNISKWNGCFFRSKSEVKIAEIFEVKSIPFISNGRGRFNDGSHRVTYEPDFIVFYKGKVAILEVDGREFHPISLQEKNDLRDIVLLDSGASFVKHYDSRDCFLNPEKIVNDFLSNFES